MSKQTFTATATGPGQIKVYDAMTGNLHRIVTLSGGTTITTGPVVFGDGFSVSVQDGTGQRYMLTYGFPLCNLRTKVHVS